MKRLFAIILTIIFTSYIACITFCVHTHIVNGQLVTHTHPYSNQQHQHSDSSIVAFCHILQSVFTATQLQGLAPADYILLSEINPYISTGNPYSFTAILATRAPPVC